MQFLPYHNITHKKAFYSNFFLQFILRKCDWLVKVKALDAFFLVREKKSCNRKETFDKVPLFCETAVALGSYISAHRVLQYRTTALLPRTLGENKFL